jgi:parallel beta-helix repeat protein
MVFSNRSLALAALVLLSMSLRPAMAVVTCGSNVAADDVLTGNLICATSPAVTVSAGATLDMAGFTVTSTTGNGIALIGSSKLVNGRVSGCAGDGVQLLAPGKNKVSNVLAHSNTSTGFYITNPGNKLTDTAAIGNGSGYVIVGGDNNAIIRSRASNNGVGFQVFGSGNKVSECTADTNTVAGGFAISGGVGNTLSKNFASGNTPNNFLIIGQEDKVLSNTASGGNNGFNFNAGLGDHKVAKNTVIGGSGVGFMIDVPDCKLSKNVVSGSGDDAFKNSGNNTSFKQCIATDSGDDGFSIAGIGIVLKDCQATGSPGEGIHFSATSSTISGCTVLGSGMFDMNDLNMNCDDNVWQDNIYATENDAGNCIQ